MWLRLSLFYPLAWSWTLLLFSCVLTTRAFSSGYNVTRQKRGDIFTNPNIHCDSGGCAEAGGYYSSSCECQCSYGKTTFIVDAEKCEQDSRIHTELPKTLPRGLASNGSIFRLSSRNQCHTYTIGSVPVLDMMSVGSRVMCTVVSGKIKKDSTDCQVLGTKSRYLYEGDWRKIWQTGRSQVIFSFVKQGNKNVLKWKSSIGRQFSGLVFALHISCNKGNRNSVLIFKSAGFHSFNGIPPTLPPLPTTQTATSVPIETTIPPSWSTAAVKAATSLSPGNKGKSSTNQQDEGLIAGLSVAGVLVFLLIIAAVVFFVIRYRQRNPDAKREAKSEANPTYERGQDFGLTMNTDDGQKYNTPSITSSYQPLVHNTRLKDDSGRIPVYQALASQENDETMKQTNPSHDYEEPTNVYSRPGDSPLYAVSVVPSTTDKAIDFDNPGYSEPDRVIPIP